MVALSIKTISLIGKLSNNSSEVNVFREGIAELSDKVKSLRQNVAKGERTLDVKEDQTHLCPSLFVKCHASTNKSPWMKCGVKPL